MSPADSVCETGPLGDFNRVSAFWARSAPAVVRLPLRSGRPYLVHPETLRHPQVTGEPPDTNEDRKKNQTTKPAYASHVSITPKGSGQ